MGTTLDWILSIAGVCAFLACALSGYLIRQHFLTFTNMEIQSKIIGILWMIPIYSVDSYIGLWMPERAMFIDMLRDCYEAYVLYLFLALLLSYLGCDDDDSELIYYLETTNSSNGIDSDGHSTPKLRSGKAFLRETKFGVLQYCVVRPFVTLLAIMLELSGVYSLWGWYLTLNIVLNVSVVYAFIALGSFYHRFQDKLAPFKPLPKFLCIKFVIFFAFWQGLAISLCIYFGVLRGSDSYSTEMISATLQDFLICVEMFLVAIAAQSAFSAESFAGDADAMYSILDSRNGSPVPSSSAAEDGSSNSNSNSNSNSSSSSRGGEYGIYDRDRAERATNIPLYKYRPPASSPSNLEPNENTATEGDSEGGVPSFAPKDENYFKSGKGGVGDGVGGDIGRSAGTAAGPWGAVATPGTPAASAQLYVADYDDDINDDKEEEIIFGDGGLSQGKRGNKKIRTSAGTNAGNDSSSTTGGFLNKNFATKAAVRDFNSSMPVVHVPSNFKPAKQGVSIRSDPRERL